MEPVDHHVLFAPIHLAHYFFLGKSNLMDAISFVLGEKTQHLRVRNLKVSLCLVKARVGVYSTFDV